MTKIVNSWNDFDLPKRVILGRTDNSVTPPEEPVASEKVPIDSEMRGMWGPRSTEAVEKVNVQLDYLVKVFQDNGIAVDRLTPLRWSQATATPDFRTDSGFTRMPPHDILLTVGNETMALANSFRCRYLEYLAYWNLTGQYFEENPEFKWTQAPRSQLTDKSYKHDYYNERITIEERLERTAAKDFVTAEVEPMWDAVDVMRLDRDLFIQHGLTTNRRAVEQSKRYYPDLRVHTMNLPGGSYSIHIDTTSVPLRLGLIVNNPQRRLPEEQRKIFEANDWQIVDAAQPVHEASSPLYYSSVWLSMNCLVLDHKMVICEVSEIYQMEQMGKLGVSIIPAPFRDAYLFDDDLHRATADVYHEDGREDYFPNQVENPTLVWLCVRGEGDLHVPTWEPSLHFQRAADRRFRRTAPRLVCADWFWISRVETQTHDLKRGHTVPNE